MMMKAPFLATTGLVLAGLALASVPIALADTVGSPCNDWMKIGTDSATGDRMFCAQTRPGDPDSPLSWLAWDDTHASWGSLPLVSPTTSPCSVPKYTLGRSTDGYIVWCTGGVWSIYSP